MRDLLACSTCSSRQPSPGLHPPCSGLPMIHRETNSVYGEVAALSTLLGYRTQNAGCCKVRPTWGLPRCRPLAPKGCSAGCRRPGLSAVEGAAATFHLALCW